MAEDGSATTVTPTFTTPVKTTTATQTTTGITTPTETTTFTTTPTATQTTTGTITTLDTTSILTTTDFTTPDVTTGVTSTIPTPTQTTETTTGSTTTVTPTFTTPVKTTTFTQTTTGITTPTETTTSTGTPTATQTTTGTITTLDTTTGLTTDFATPDVTTGVTTTIPTPTQTTEIKTEDSATKEIKPVEWKTWLSNVRYYNPERWDFKILKLTSFSPSMMRNMFSKYWNPPQMKNDGQRETEDRKETSVTQIDEGKNGESQNETDSTNKEQSAVTEEPHDQNKSDWGNEASENPEVLSDRVLQDLKEAPIGHIKILWIGHASLLIQMEGKNILTDPIFSSKAGPKNKIGYSRYRRPAVTVEMLKDLGDFQIDAVVISHNHYDHFDKQSVMDLKSAFRTIKWFVPMNLKSDLISLGCKNVYEATWWQPLKFDEGITFHFTPAKHWSGRNPTDWYTSLWGSWVIEGKTAKVYFAGDTGYQEEIFKAIRDKFGPITIAALPIGAYEPREMMKCQHINPEEAVKIHKILDVQKSIGIHWRTFQLSCEGIDQPVHDLEVAKTAHGVGKEDFITLEKSLITTIECKKQDDIQEERSEPELCTPD